jgi:ubiquitin-conjugating enzyme E2 Z
MSSGKDNESIFITTETTKRLIRDIRELKKNPLTSEGIIYKHDEENILKGYAYICGPPDSMYFGGNYFYEFIFPCDYPHSPPKVTFLNMGGIDNKTRWHPNMYKNGKLCLSVLNTWSGNQWSGCQTIRTILLTILSVMDNKPLLHEPGFTEKHKDFTPYNEIISYKNFEFSICKILLDEAKYLDKYKKLFQEDINLFYIKNKEELLKYINTKKNYIKSNFRTTIYNLNIDVDWNLVLNDFNRINI